MDPTESLPEDDDLTVLEYVRAWIHAQFKLGDKPSLDSSERLPENEVRVGVKPVLWIGLVLIVVGQILMGLEKSSFPIAGVLVIAVGICCLWVGFFNAEKELESVENNDLKEVRFQLKPIWLMATIVMSLVCYLLFTENRFGFLQTLSWLTAISCGVYTFWPAINSKPSEQKHNWKFWLNWQTDRMVIILALIVALLGLAFRLKELTTLPPELISAQVETYYTVSEIQQGGGTILFSRNAVPEPLNYYWANLVGSFSGRALKMETVRLANAVAGLIGLGFVFGLGKQIANRWVGFVSAGLAAVSFWLVLQERAAIGGGLVFPLMAIALFGLVKGLEEQDGRFYLLSAVAAGLGLMSNKIFLIYPLVALVAILCWKKGKAIAPEQLVVVVGIGLFLSVITAMPLIRAISLEPMSYFAPILARVGQSEVAYPRNPILIFLGNFAKALGIVNWTNQGSWVDSIANRGAVDSFTAVFFIVGIVSVLRRYLEGKDWKLLMILLLFPILLLPSVLALAFPSENPSMTRAVGAVIPVVLIAAMGVVDLIKSFMKLLRLKSLVAVVIASVLLLAPVVVSNHNLVFQQYASQYKQSAWNASEMADVINRFYASGKEGLSYLISYPYWVDSRAVAISMGRPQQNLSLPATEIINTQNVTISKLFILNPMDKDSIAELQAVYPEGVISTYQSLTPDKNFILFIVGQ